MKKLLLGTVALFALSVGGPALAADMPAYKAPPPAPYYNWSGYYIGFNIGGQWNEVERTYPTPFASTRTLIATDSNDGIFGFHLGAQYQFGYWVLGVEAALSAGFHEMRGITGVLPAPGFIPNLIGEHKITNIFTVGPKLGYAFDRWMIYGTGGYASADLKADYCIASTGVCNAFPREVGQSRNHGWFAGAGIDYMIHKGPLVDVILGAEYQHYDVDSKRASCFNLGCTPATALDYDLAASGDIFRAKLTIKYNPWGYATPVYAKY
jgi:outer membrane immunogenic protein